LDIEFSNIEGSYGNLVIDENSSLHWLDGNIDTDPLFRDPDNGDFRLTADSPCIDAGDPEAELDPDGTTADMGAFYFHQRDIDVAPEEVRFEPLVFGEIDSLPIEIRNVGGNDLIIETIVTELDWACFGHQFVDLPVTIPPDSTFVLWAIFQPVPRRALQSVWQIESNDPDEQMFEIRLSGEINAVPSDNLQSSIYNLQSPFPNPFNGQTTVRFSLSAKSASSAVNLAVYGLDGRLVEELIDGKWNSENGTEHSVAWNADGLPGGVYIIRLEVGEEVKTIKAVLLR
jgi:hypothetical protein